MRLKVTEATSSESCRAELVVGDDPKLGAGELFGDPKWWRDTAAVLAVTLAAYLYTYDPATLIPWDRVTPDSFDLQALYEARGFGP